MRIMFFGAVLLVAGAFWLLGSRDFLRLSPYVIGVLAIIFLLFVTRIVPKTFDLISRL